MKKNALAYERLQALLTKLQASNKEKLLVKRIVKEIYAEAFKDGWDESSQTRRLAL